MAEYIDRYYAIKELYEYYDYNYPTASGDFDEYATHEVPNILRSIPASDVQPIRRGHWEDSGNFYFKKCSECGSKWDISITNNYFAHYCPRCGARMNEQEVEEDA